MTIRSALMSWAVLAAASLLAAPAQAAPMVRRTMCVFDLVGQHGDAFNLMKDYKIAALAWGVDFELKPYTNEKIAAEDLKAGQCDAALLTGLRGRLFNSYTGSLDSIGSQPDYDSVRLVHQAMANPKLAPQMKSGPYEVTGMLPLGAAFIFVNDKAINNVGALSGKRIAVLDFDKAQATMVRRVGASPVSADTISFAGKFNNRSVDVCAAPAVAYRALELYKGLEPKGGVVRFAVAQITLQMIARHEQFTGASDFSQKSRQWFFSQFDRALSLIKIAEKEIDDKYWIDLPLIDKIKYDEMMRQSRIALRDDGVYDAATLTLLRKVRCKLDGARAECTEKTE